MKTRYKYLCLALLLAVSIGIGISGVGDLPMYYEVGKYASQSEFSKIYGINPGVGRFFYGPVSLLVFQPLSHLSYPVAKSFWMALNIAAFVLFWYGLVYLYPWLWSETSRWGFLFLWALSIKPIHATFQSHNVQLMIAAVLVTAQRFSRAPARGAPVSSVRPWLAGALCSLAAAVKVFPIFMAVFYFLSDRRAVRWGSVLGGAIAILAPFIWFGPTDARYLTWGFYENLHNFHDAAPLTTDAVTLSLASLMMTWLQSSLGVAQTLWWIKTVMITASALFFLHVYVRRAAIEARGESTHYFALAGALMALLNSSTRPDYFVFFLPAFCSMTELWNARRLALGAKIATLGSAALLALIAEWVLRSRNLTHQLELLRFPVLGMIALCLALGWQLVRPGPKTRAA